MSNIYKIIERLCNDKGITKEEQRLVKEYLESGNDLIKHLNKYNERWEKTGIDPLELSGDGFARDMVASTGMGEKAFIKERSKKIDGWENELFDIEVKLRKLES